MKISVIRGIVQMRKTHQVGKKHEILRILSKTQGVEALANHTKKDPTLIVLMNSHL